MVAAFVTGPLVGALKGSGGGFVWRMGSSPGFRDDMAEAPLLHCWLYELRIFPLVICGTEDDPFRARQTGTAKILRGRLLRE